LTSSIWFYCVGLLVCAAVNIYAYINLMPGGGGTSSVAELRKKTNSHLSLLDQKFRREYGWSMVVPKPAMRGG